MNREEFLRLAAEGYNRIPLARETLADFDTPLSIYLKLADQPNSYLLESVQGGEKWGRYSIIGLPCRTVMRVHGHHVSVTHDGVEIESLDVEDPLDFVETFKARYNVPTIAGLPRFNGGLVGYFGYDCVRYVEKRLANCPNPDPLGVPDILLMVSDAVVVFDNLAGKMHAIVLIDPAQQDAYASGVAQLDELMHKLRQPITPRRGLDLDRPPAADPVFRSSFTQDDYEAAVDTIKQYILAGDVMQVVPSQRMSIDFSAAPIDLYRALRCFNPTPYMYFFNFGDFHVVGSSPEVLVRVEDNLITVRPIAGTRPRGATEEADRALEEDLLSDHKEIAEHLMLIDLGRNDTGRVSEIGTVKLTEKMVIERYSNVMHIVSNVTGQLKSGLSAMDALRAILPAGTLSGAPKIRAMQIIDELEPTRRSLYCGSLMYLDVRGEMDSSIAIRSLLVKDGQISCWGGGGIVADSDCEAEYQETFTKVRVLLETLEAL
ncbi:anthranilate synthase component I [Pseudomonas syringae]|uniref:anthranilate synthase component I n=1 Tax=Pseudomonas syringae TaxID=317 RepID=UPI000E32C1DF|nr:anthranilate synthase component I [Pseudomonas syringae]